MARLAQGLVSNGVGSNPPKKRQRKRKLIPDDAHPGSSSSPSEPVFTPPPETLMQPTSDITPSNVNRHNQQQDKEPLSEDAADDEFGISSTDEEGAT
jgi:hypothetical protein